MIDANFYPGCRDWCHHCFGGGVVVVVGFLFGGWFWLCFFPPVGMRLGLVFFCQFDLVGFEPLVEVFFSTESLILAQDERWRRA